jgi:hypothetical protein
VREASANENGRANSDGNKGNRREQRYLPRTPKQATRTVQRMGCRADRVRWRWGQLSEKQELGDKRECSECEGSWLGRWCRAVGDEAEETRSRSEGTERTSCTLQWSYSERDGRLGGDRGAGGEF